MISFVLYTNSWRSHDSDKERDAPIRSNTDINPAGAEAPHGQPSNNTIAAGHRPPYLDIIGKETTGSDRAVHHLVGHRGVFLAIGTHDGSLGVIGDVSDRDGVSLG